MLLLLLLFCEEEVQDRVDLIANAGCALLQFCCCCLVFVVVVVSAVVVAVVSVVVVVVVVVSANVAVVLDGI